MIPPVGQKRASGNGEAIDLRYAAPPDASAGKNFISVNPASSTASTSETVAVPGRKGTPESAIAASRVGVEPGETRNCAPASTASLAWPGDTMVPAPTRISGTSVGDRADRVERDGRAQGQLDHRQAALDEGACDRHRVREVVDDDDRHDRDEDSRDSGVLGNGDLLGGGGQRTDDAGAGLGGADDGAEPGEQLASGPRPLDVVGSATGGLAALELGVRDVEVEQAASRRRR